MRKNWKSKGMLLGTALAASMMIPVGAMAADGVLEGLNVEDTAKLVNFEFDKDTTEYNIDVFQDVYGVLFTPEFAEGEIEVSVEGLDGELALYEDTYLGFNNPDEASKKPGATTLTVKPGERFEICLTEAREANISAQNEDLKKRAQEDDQNYTVTIAAADQTYTVNIHRPGTDEVVNKFQKLTWAVPDDSGKEMYYMLYVPEDYDESKEYPLLLAPHGSGQRLNEPEDILIRVAQATAPVIYGKEIIIVAPQCNYTTFELTGNENTWCDGDTLELSPFGKGAMEIVYDVIGNYNIDTDRIYCAGASMGGAGTIGFLGNAPELFAGGWICCQSRITNEGVKVFADNIKDQNLAISIIYSKQDSEGANLGAERLFREFDAAGIAYEKTIYDDEEYDYLRPTNHFSWVPFFDSEANIDKLLSVTKSGADAAVEVTGGVAVEANEASNTGYTATFTYIDEFATNVEVLGSFDLYKANDERFFGRDLNLEEGDDSRNYIVPLEDWEKDADLWHVNLDVNPVEMTKGDNGVWTCSVDLPGGSYVYRYNVSYNNGASYQLIMDPVNLPAINALGASDKRSEFQVPYDSEKQGVIDDWTFITPVENAEEKGTIMHFNYISKDDVVRPAMLYLPAGYDPEREEPYKVLYLSHGGGGSETNWFHQGHAQNIVDRLVAEGVCEPFIIVAMNNSQFNRDNYSIYETLKDYVVPYMEANYNVSTEASGRAHAGLSMGSMITTSLLCTDPALFGYYGMFSGGSIGAYDVIEDFSVFDGLGLYLGAGFADFALGGVITVSEKYDEVGVDYNNGNGLVIVQGGHDWYTWDQLLKDFIETILWK